MADWTDIANTIHGGINTTAGLGFGIYDRYKNKQDSDRDYNLAYMDFINQMNMQKYGMDLQQTMFEREDNSVQRRVADMKAAGINPILAAGQGAQAGVEVTQHPASTEGMRNSIQNKMQNRAMNTQYMLNAMTQAADVSKTLAQKRLLEAQAKSTELDPLKFEWQKSMDRAGLSQRESEIILKASHLELERARNIILDRQTTVQEKAHELDRLLAIPEIANKIIEGKITLYDFIKSIEMTMRYKDSTNAAERAGNKIGSSIFGTDAANVFNVEYDKLVGSIIDDFDHLKFK